MTTATASEMDPVIRHAIGKALATIGAELMNGYANGAAPVPAKRGRSRKAIEPVADAPAAEPKRRGRPRKVTAETAPVADAPAAEPKRRGRPRKVTPEPIVAADAPAAPAKRGRPRKAVAPSFPVGDRAVLVRRPGGPRPTVYHSAAEHCGFVRNESDFDTVTEAEAVASGMVACVRCPGFKSAAAA